MSRLIKILLVIIVILDLFTSTLTAQEIIGEKPTLNQHTFVPSNYFRSPFVNTTITMPLGVGSTVNFNFPLPDDGLDTIPGLKGEVLFAILGFHYRQKVQDWIAFNIRLGMSARLGTNFESIISQGFNTVINFEMGTMIKLMQREKTMLSMSIEAKNYNGNFIDIRGFVLDVINGVPDPKIVKKVPALTTGLGLHFAWGINEVIGFRAESIYSYGETFTRGQSSSRYILTAVLDADFNKKYNVPLGVAASFSVTTDPDVVYVDDQSARMFFFKIAYTGRKDFDLGIESGFMVLPLQNLEEKPKVTITSLTMSYFFN